MFWHVIVSCQVSERRNEKKLMDTRYTYALIDIACIIVPFIASFWPRIQFYRQWRNFLLPCLLTALFFIGWDMAFTARGIWGFNPRYISGIYLGNLPVEEIAFFICIPYACVFTYYCVRKFLRTDALERLAGYVVWMLAVLLISAAVFNLARLYTSVTFLLLAAALLLTRVFRVNYTAPFMLMYVMVFLPFLLSNGALTGSFTDEPIVWYNNNFNLSIRLFTIPVEDCFYAMLMMLMNVAGFEYLRSKTTPVKHRHIALIGDEHHFV